ncbi:MAG: malonyl-ACP O-methyltransferase BioC [Gammaproteobacteria bacterium]
MADDHSAYRIDKAQARRAFERAAPTYDAAAALQNEIGARLIERLDLIRMQPARILDLGAGTGVFTDVLLKRYRKADVIALDIAHSMLRRVQARGGWFRKAACTCADSESLPFAAHSFDFIFSNLMLQWCTDLEQAFVELRRVLAPGGLLLFTTFGPDTLSELRASWEAVDGYTHTNAFIDMHDVGDALVRAQWAEPVMDTERITVTYRNVRSLMQDLKRIGAHNVTHGRPRGMTGRRRLQQLTGAYERYRVDGVLPASYEVVYGHAWSPLAGDNEVPLASLQRPGSLPAHD